MMFAQIERKKGKQCAFAAAALSAEKDFGHVFPFTILTKRAVKRFCKAK